jgi:hypothetical protein
MSLGNSAVTIRDNPYSGWSRPHAGVPVRSSERQTAPVPVSRRTTLGRAGSRRRLYTPGVGYYYGPGTPPPNDGKPDGFRETVTIILVVFKLLALPVGALMGMLLALVLLFYAFAFSPFLGFGLIGMGVAALVARGIWEAKHPPELR